MNGPLPSRRHGCQAPNSAQREAIHEGLSLHAALVGGGRQLTTLSNFQLGLLWQHRPKADYLRLVLSYSHNFDLRKRKPAEDVGSKR